jgi:hypothetical protein
MPHINVRLTAPTQSIQMNVGPIGIKNVRLIQYQAEGLVNTGVLYFEITDQPTTSIQGNVGSSFFPLMMASFPVFQGPSIPSPIMINEGNSCWNNAKLLTFKVFNSNMTPAVFTTITLLFQYEETLYPEQVQHSGPACEDEFWPRNNVNKVIDKKDLNWFYDQKISAAKENTFYLPK